MLLLLEAREELEVLLGLEEGFAVVYFLLDGAAAGDDGVDDGACLGEVQRGHVVEVAEFELDAGFFVAGWGALGAGGRVWDYGRWLPICGSGIGHGGG